MTCASLRSLSTRLASIAALASVLSTPAQAAMDWTWSYTTLGGGVIVGATGTLRTADTPDAEGFYQILSIAGNKDGIDITGLYPTGQAIPGNEPYKLDNLIRPEGSGGQVTVHGLGFSTAIHEYVNVFYADFLPVPGYMAVTTSSGKFSEGTIGFQAKVVAVPEPEAVGLMLSGLAVAGFALAKRRR